jgi:SAM-dependent methyltransferase
MDLRTYAAEAAVEADHWWYVGRRQLFSELIGEMNLPPNAAILDVGTSAGTNLRMLRDRGHQNVVGLDSSPEAIRFCTEKGLGEVRIGDICALPFPDATFDLVLATDILEHVDDDLLALRELRRVLKPDGRLLLTVPTFKLLWGLEDEVSHHKRRYRMSQILERVRTAGLTESEHFYFNFLLFVPILAARRLMRLFRIKLESDNQFNPAIVNRMLSPLFRFDIRVARRLHPPIGVSALVVASLA